VGFAHLDTDHLKLLPPGENGTRWSGHIQGAILCVEGRTGGVEGKRLTAGTNVETIQERTISQLSELFGKGQSFLH
jgi:hypothetical protein